MLFANKKSVNLAALGQPFCKFHSAASEDDVENEIGKP